MAGGRQMAVVDIMLPGKDRFALMEDFKKKGFRCST